MTIQEAIKARHTVRAYKNQPLTEDIVKVLEERAASVLGQMNGTIPSTWEGQKNQPQNLISCDNINLQDLGGI